MERAERHSILGGKVQVYRRGGLAWHCAARVKGERLRATTKEDSLALAKEYAEDWYMTLIGKARAGLPLKTKTEPTFNEIADLFEAEYAQITDGQRSPKWVQSHKDRLRLHLRPFFGRMGISEVNGSAAQNYRVHRAGQFGRLPPKDANGKHIRPPRPPSRSTMHDEIGTLSLVLKTAMRHGKIIGMPDLSPPYRRQKKVYHRPWFTLEEYKALYKATGEAARTAPEAHCWNYEQLHDQVLFLGNTGLRPDEASNLQHRDVTIAMDEDTGEQILEIEVRGKTGYGPCKSMPGAVEPYRRLLARAKPAKRGRKVERERMIRRGQAPPEVTIEYPKPSDRLFPSNHTDLLNDILAAKDLKYDRDGQPRVLYSLRHTYICLRLLDGADIYNLAKNCRTSVEMIEKHYAIHLKNVIDASAINVRKPRKKHPGNVMPNMSKDGGEAGTGAPSAGA
jgi:integrase